MTDLDATGEIVISGISKTFGAARVVDDVTLRVRPGRIHALVGGNGSGKSTVLKMLAGVYRADPGGTVVVGADRYPAEHFGPREAARHGLRFVHQDLGIIDDFSIAENIALGSGYPTRAPGWVRWRALDRDAQALLTRVGLQAHPHTPAADLRPSDRALVAIARALRDDGRSGRPGVLVLDEPTASLPHDDVARLLRALDEFRAAGHSVVFVSHHLSEVFGLADDVTVLRDGRVVASGAIEEYDIRAIVSLIAGHEREVSVRAIRQLDTSAPVVLGLRDFAAGPISELDLEVRAGEIVGIAGLLGSGRTSVLRGIFGDLAHRGRIEIDGSPVVIRTSANAVRCGVVFVPEDRRRDAGLMDRAVWENVSAAVLSRYRRILRIDRRRERNDAIAVARDFQVRAASMDLPLESLSGGNQQKAILARWLRDTPRVILLDEPTQGVDVVARDEIHALVRAKVDTGAAALVVSSDFDELELLCDRVIVVRDGRMRAVVDGDDVTIATMTALTQIDEEAA